jgi:hypothetical protein
MYLHSAGLGITTPARPKRDPLLQPACAQPLLVPVGVPLREYIRCLERRLGGSRPESAERAQIICDLRRAKQRLVLEPPPAQLSVPQSSLYMPCACSHGGGWSLLRNRIPDSPKNRAYGCPCCFSTSDAEPNYFCGGHARPEWERGAARRPLRRRSVARFSRI